MNGETNLSELLKGLRPRLNKGDFVFVCVADEEAIPLVRADVLGEFREPEGRTLIIEQTIANQHHLQYQSVYAWITLEVYSSLEAVGLTAAFSNELAQHNVSCNVIAGYHHDHIFVNKNDAQRAVRILNDLSERAG